MGGCASRPKDLALDAQVPAEDPAKTVPEPVAETVISQESNGGEEKKEESLIDISAPAEEAPEVEEAKTVEPAEPEEESAEQKVEEPTEKPEADEVTPKSEEKTEAVSAPVA